MTIDHFTRLGLPRRFGIDTAALEQNYRERSRQVHPDRFAKAPPRERMESLQAATALNDAYRLLRRPVGRAEYLLELEGVKLGDNDPVDPEFLMEVMELREALLEAKHAGPDGAPRVAAMAADMRARYD